MALTNGLFARTRNVNFERSFDASWALKRGFHAITHVSTMGTTEVAPSVQFARIDGSRKPLHGET